MTGGIQNANAWLKFDWIFHARFILYLFLSRVCARAFQLDSSCCAFEVHNHFTGRFLLKNGLSHHFAKLNGMQFNVVVAAIISAMSLLLSSLHSAIKIFLLFLILICESVSKANIVRSFHEMLRQSYNSLKKWTNCLRPTPRYLLHQFDEFAANTKIYGLS